MLNCSLNGTHSRHLTVFFGVEYLRGPKSFSLPLDFMLILVIISNDKSINSKNPNIYKVNIYKPRFASTFVFPTRQFRLPLNILITD